MPELMACFHHQQHNQTTFTASLTNNLSHQQPLSPTTRSPKLSPTNTRTTHNLSFTASIPTLAMAATTFFTTASLVNYGRSGYNKGNSDDDEEQNKLVNYGRSGYNKDDKDDDEENKQN